MEDEKILELIKLQTRPRIHIGIEEKIPTTRYGNKTYTVNLSLNVDNIDEKTIMDLFAIANVSIAKQKQKDGILSETELTRMAKELGEKAWNSPGIPYLSKPGEPSLIEQAFQNVKKEMSGEKDEKKQ